MECIQPPKIKKEVRALLGLVGFYRAYIPHFSTLTAPLSDLTKKGYPNKIQWTEELDTNYQILKQCITERPILKLPNLGKRFFLQYDASSVGVGAVLLQKHDGELFPVAYASKKLNKAQCGYSTIERECLALVFGFKKFNVYLYGREFTLQTDHQPLVYLNKCKQDNSRILRWSLYMQSYDYILEAIKGKFNVVADVLSRLV